MSGARARRANTLGLQVSAELNNNGDMASLSEDSVTEDQLFSTQHVFTSVLSSRALCKEGSSRANVSLASRSLACSSCPANACGGGTSRAPSRDRIGDGTEQQVFVNTNTCCALYCCIIYVPKMYGMQQNVALPMVPLHTGCG